MLLRTGMLLAMLSLFAGCSTPRIDVNLPTARMDLPEVGNDSFRGRVGAIAAQYHRVTLTSTDSETNTPTDSSTLVGNVSTREKRFMGDFKMNALPGLEFGARRGQSGVTLFQGKYQLLGSSYQQSDAGNLSLAASLGYGWVQDTADQHDASSCTELWIFCSTGSPIGWESDYWESEVDTRIMDFALIGGYRLSQQWLAFGGLYRQHYDMTAQIRYGTRQNSQTTWAASLETRQDGRQSGLNLGLEWRTQSKGLSVIAELSRARLSWDNVPDSYQSFFQAGMYLSF